MFKIVQAPDDVLSKKAQPVTKFDTSLHELIDEMIETLDHARDPEGVGLAAPQIGFLYWRWGKDFFSTLKRWRSGNYPNKLEMIS